MSAQGFIELVESCGDTPLPLDRAAALLAVEEDTAADVDTVLGELDELAAGVRLPPRVSVVEAVARLNHHLFHELQFHGDAAEYDHPRNSLLHRVLQRRQGLPILLSVVYCEVARRVGVDVRGVGFPRHFMVCPVQAEPTFYIDPFHRGEIRREEELRGWLREWFEQRLTEEDVRRWLQPISAREVVARICHNLKRSFLRRDDAPGALRQVQRLLALQPEDLTELRDRGLLHAHLGQVEQAVADLETYLARAGTAADAARIAVHLAGLKGH